MNIKRGKVFRLKEEYAIFELQGLYGSAVFVLIASVLSFVPNKEISLKAIAISFYILGFLTFILGMCYQKKRTEAEKREKTWQHDHPDEAAARFQFYSANQDLGSLIAEFTINVLTPQNSFVPYEPCSKVGVMARESELYFSTGQYQIEISTRDYETKTLNISVANENIGTRLWFTSDLGSKKLN